MDTEKILIQGRRLELRPLKQEDHPAVYNWMQEGVFVNTCSTTPLPDRLVAFSKLLERYIRVGRCYRLIVERQSGAGIGFVYDYSIHKDDAYSYATIYLDVKSRSAWNGSEAMLMFLIELFMVGGMNKVYLEVFEYNQASLSVIKNAGFDLEGQFPDERLHRGRRWTRNCFAVYPRHVSVLVHRIGRRVLSPATIDRWQDWSKLL